VTNKIVLENMRHRPMRSLLSILLIGVPVTMILCLIGLSRGMSEDSQARARGIGADVIVRGSSASSVTSFSGASVNEGMVKFIEEQPHVKMATGVIVHSVEFPLTASGIDLDAFTRMSGGFEYLSGGPLRNDDDILIDQLYADQKHVKVGDKLRLMNRDWHVAGIIGGGKLARIVVKKSVLQDIDSATNKVSAIYVQGDDPAHDKELAAQLGKTLEGYPVITMEEFLSMFAVNNIPALKAFIGVIVGIGIIIGFAVVCLSMYMAVLQRTREIGILKALGGSKSFILRIILTEAWVLAIGGTLLGIAMSYGAAELIRAFAPASLPMIIVKPWWAVAGIITFIAATIGALYPGLSAARQDPIEALAYE
jgi:putative ABC transport system permease protein